MLVEVIVYRSNLRAYRIVEYHVAGYAGEQVIVRPPEEGSN